ncbi:MAG: Bacterial alpha-L-rhamnosidase [Tepidisphaera sp.]|nr:Bacterial alpha-L-rhamnosidase [Tepidisphaera sp.]
MVRWLTSVFFAFIVIQSAHAQPGSLQPGGLTCESMTDPIGLDVATPRLSWTLESGRRNERQTAYQVLVASSPESLEKDNGDLWDSGRVESAATTFVHFAGSPLHTGEACYWKVRAWDRDRVPGAWSDLARWEMGLMSAADWRASWIDATPNMRPVKIVHATYHTKGGEASVDVTKRVEALVAKNEPVFASNEAMGSDPKYGLPKVLSIEYVVDGQTLRADVAEDAAALLPSSIPYLRKGFAIDKPIASARLYATALGVYEVWLNGDRVGDQHMTPGWTDYRKRVQIQTYDVTHLLKQGGNTLGAIVGPGWFAGRAGLFHARAFYGKSPALLTQLEIRYKDGTTQTIVSDGTWMRHDGPTLNADIMDGETYDARAEVRDWCDAGATKGTDFTDQSDWSPVSTRDEHRNLHAQTDQPVRVLAELSTKRLTQPVPGHWVFDLGQNMVGVAHLITHAQPVGTRVTIRYAEMLNPDGTLYTDNLRGAGAIDSYTCRGDAEEAWQPRFTFHGFRYVEISGLATPPQPDDVVGIVIGTDLPRIGEFDCSDDRINQLQSNITWGLRGNTLSIPTDCPQRDERMGWMADTQVFAPTAAYNAGVGPFFNKWMRDVRDAQRADGAESDVAPVMKGLNYGTPAWGDAGTIVPWTVYVFTGDAGILRDSIDSMSRWVDWCVEHSDAFIRARDRGNDYGDWLSIDADTPKDLIGTAFAARSAWIVAQSMAVLGREQDAAHYREIFEKFRDAFQSKYVQADGTVGNATQTCQLLALQFDLVPQAQRDAVASHLVEDLRRRGWRLSTGFIGVSQLLPALDDAGHPDAAYRVLTQDAFPSWLFSVDQGATTIWERWDGWTPDRGMNDPGMNSFNHFALGSCGQWLFAGVAGIQPDPAHPGFSHFFVRPRIDGPLTHASATYHSPHGLIESTWKLADGGLSLTVVVPPNTRATVTIPARVGEAVHESGAPVQKRLDEITVQSRDERGMTVEIGSGRYEFSSVPPAFRPGNPVIPGWYADPEAALFDGQAWIYPTFSAPYNQQTRFDAFSSNDLVRWTRHPGVLRAADIPWAKRAMWAPSVIENHGKYYFFFAANDIQSDKDLGGIGVAVADHPQGPFRDHLGKPLVDAFHNGAQPIDPFVFRDDDGTDYLIYGGWKHCNIARLNADYTVLEPLPGGEMFKEVTPQGYVEGPFMMKHAGKYYFMWSEGGWTGPNYSVAYGVGDSPLGPFTRKGTILKQDPAIATGAGHHSVLHLKNPDRFYIVYHRRPLAETDANHRVVCIDKLEFDAEGNIKPVRITTEGVEPTTISLVP